MQVGHRHAMHSRQVRMNLSSALSAASIDCVHIMISGWGFRVQFRVQCRVQLGYVSYYENKLRRLLVWLGLGLAYIHVRDSDLGSCFTIRSIGSDSSKLVERGLREASNAVTDHLGTG